MSRFARPSPVYGTGILLLDDTGGYSWRPRPELHRRRELCRLPPSSLGDSAWKRVRESHPDSRRMKPGRRSAFPPAKLLAEEVGAAPTAPAGAGGPVSDRVRPADYPRLFHGGGRGSRTPKAPRGACPLSRRVDLLRVPIPPGVPAAGVAPAFPPYERGGLLLADAGEILEPMAGVEPALRSYRDRGLPLSDTGVEGPPGVAPGLGGPQPPVQNGYTSAPDRGAPGRSRTSVWRLSTAGSAVELRAPGAAGGLRTRGLLPGREASCSSTTAA